MEGLAENSEAQSLRASVYVVGTIKSGKSSLVNSLAGKDILPRGSGVITFNLTRLRYVDRTSAKLRFWHPRKLQQQLELDGQLLNFTEPVPANPYDLQTLEPYRRAWSDFVRSRPLLDGRGDQNTVDGDSDGLLSPAQEARQDLRQTSARRLPGLADNSLVGLALTRMEKPYQDFNSYRATFQKRLVKGRLQVKQLCIPLGMIQFFNVSCSMST